MTKDISDSYPRIIFNGVTGRYHIQYETLKGKHVISGLSWKTQTDAQKIIDNILKNPRELRHIL